MSRLYRLAILIGVTASLTIGIVSAPAAFAQLQAGVHASDDRYVGYWEGVLSTGSAKVHLGLTLQRDSTGGLRGGMIAIDQGNAAMPGSIMSRNDSLMVTLPAQHATYSGIITPSGDSLRGTFVQGDSFPLVMAKKATTPLPSQGTTILSRRQDPKPPFPYRSEDVHVASSPGVVLAGTLILPEGNGPFPAVVFVTGSGPQNRDEEIVGHRPFLVIADYLARQGIASLRYDDRGTARSTGSFESATSADFADDAEAAVHFLRTVHDIAADRVGILGHSEGGLIGPMVAARTKDVAFLVLLAGPGIPDDSLLLLQSRALLAANGVGADRVERANVNTRRLFQAVKETADSVSAARRLERTRQEIVASLPEEQRAAVAAQLQQNIQLVLTPWMRYFLRYDPRIALHHVHVPVLAMGGTLDLQVTYPDNLRGIDAALKEAGNHDYRVVELPRLNHMFQTATTGAPSEYATIDETVSPAALELIASWIREHVAKK